MKRNKTKKSYLSRINDFNKIDFYTCWDDFNLIQKALQFNSNDTVFMITSGGCNVLNTLVYNPKKIISVDYNPYQNYLLELKIAAIKSLNYEDFLQLMGVNSSKFRENIYNTIRGHLSKNAREFWDSNTFIIQKGIISAGEINVKLFGQFLRYLKGDTTINNFFVCKTIDEQTNYFYTYIYGFPWKLLVYISYNNIICKLSLCLIALHELPFKRERLSGYFRYIKKIHYPKNHLKKIDDIFTKIPIKHNSYASLLLLNRYSSMDCFPPYLKESNFEVLKKRVERIELKTTSVIEALQELPNNSITKFYFSNIFDWTNDKEFRYILKEIIRVGNNRSRVFYLGTIPDRDIPTTFTEIQTDNDLAFQLLQEDRTTMYSKMVIGEIQKYNL